MNEHDPQHYDPGSSFSGQQSTPPPFAGIGVSGSAFGVENSVPPAPGALDSAPTEQQPTPLTVVSGDGGSTVAPEQSTPEPSSARAQHARAQHAVHGSAGRGDAPVARGRLWDRRDAAAASRRLEPLSDRRAGRARVHIAGASRQSDRRRADGRRRAREGPARAARDHPRPARARDRRTLRARSPRPRRVQGRHGGGEPADRGRGQALRRRTGRLRRRAHAAAGDVRPGQRAGGRRHRAADADGRQACGRLGGGHRGADQPLEPVRGRRRARRSRRPRRARRRWRSSTCASRPTTRR